jgi:bis(5'-nucleosyl)-tetraphosphatase (symmetrical)
MAVYAIGDVQGCFDELQTLLTRVDFDPGRDRLWFAGDLVNRGPKSLETLRFAHRLNAVVVLGNHDLHLLACAADPGRRKRKDTLQDILKAPDADLLLDWLRHRPLLHHDAGLGYTLVHAGLPPQWDLRAASACAAEVEQALRGDDYSDFLTHMYGDQPDRWDPALTGRDRLRFIVNCFTRLRYCDRDGRLALKEKGPPGSQPEALKPWFAWETRNSRTLEILFGHWSTLGAYDGPGVPALDTGCLWGGRLTAVRIDRGPPERVELPCAGARQPTGSRHDGRAADRAQRRSSTTKS